MDFAHDQGEIKCKFTACLQYVRILKMRHRRYWPLEQFLKALYK